MNIEIGQIITQIISFLIMFWVLKRFAWKPLLASLEERKQRVQAEFDEIEKQKNDISKLSDEYQNKLNEIDTLAASKTKEAIEEGREIAVAIKEEAAAQSRALIAKAHSDIEKEVYKAKSELKNEIVNISTSIAEKLMKRQIDKEAQKEILNNVIKEGDV